MALDLSTLSARKREEYVNLGRQYGSADTLAQANQTINSLGTEATFLVDHGFGPDDATRLTGARDGLLAAGGGREGARTGKKTTSLAYVSAMDAGKGARTQGRAVLGNAAASLAELEGDAPQKAVERATAVLERTGTAGDDATLLADQLGLLAGALQDKVIAEEAKGRGGPAAVATIGKAAKKLRDVAPTKAPPRGTPVETEEIDLFDGLIVTLCRAARKSARSAGRLLGRPALAKAFALTKLYAARGAERSTGTTGGGTTPPA
ncbi:MAG: hypothetical protein HY720_13895 [Planctomycetes bacterium]|nr:hypothetical protein [Planctomycetota bacterium]